MKFVPKCAGVTLRGALFLLSALCGASHLGAQAVGQDPALWRRLLAGQVVIEEPAIDPARPRGRVRAAVLIHASPEAIWQAVTDCREALALVPGLQSCRLVSASADGRRQDIEHEVHYSWLLPTVRYMFRAEYEPPQHIGFHLLSGDLRAEEGDWRLRPSPEGSGTLVEYEMYLDPGFWVPQLLVRRSLRNDLPSVLEALRRRLERVSASAGRARLAPHLRPCALRRARVVQRGNAILNLAARSADLARRFCET
jgi:carbon monoxide dehydrogenase subunit G